MRYFITFLIGIGLVVLIIILLIRAIFGGGGDTTEQRPELVSYANSNVIMRLTIDGPVNADEIHEQARIDVSQYSSELRLISGYEGRVEKTHRFNSNPTAYANFLRALDLQGYTRGDDSEELKDERGYCPDGFRYIYEIIDGSTREQRLWSTSCEEAASFQGNADAVINLFKAQIPGYEEKTQETELQ